MALRIQFKGHYLALGLVFMGHYLALRATDIGGIYGIFSLSSTSYHSISFCQYSVVDRSVYYNYLTILDTVQNF